MSVDGDIVGAQHGGVHSGALAGNLPRVLDDVNFEGQLWGQGSAKYRKDRAFD